MPAGATHLVSRFFASVVARPVSETDQAWVAQHLAPSEYDVWLRLGRADRAESVRTGRRAEEAFARGDARCDDAGAWIAAALLHDVGKLDARFGPVRRALATLAGRIGGRYTAVRWAHLTHGQRRRAGLYLRHAELGAHRLELAGARPEAVTWARVHHEPEHWRTAGVPHPVGALLARADGETVPEH